MSEVKVNKISPRTACGTVTLGDSGDTFTIPAGATITNSGTAAGFGATGAVSWDTTAKTTGFTAVDGVGYFVNTTAGAITVTLPLSPAAGAVIGVSDYAGTADTNAITIGRNGSNINGAAADLVIEQENSAITLVYVDGTQGWKATDTSSLTDVELAPTYITATGGTITTVDTNYKVHTFTGPGTFCVSAIGNPLGSTLVDYVVVAGGGSGGGTSSFSGTAAGGGGAGGYRESPGTTTCYTASPLGASPAAAVAVTVQGYSISVGAGSGYNPSDCSGGGDGFPTTALAITSTAGGGGGGVNRLAGNPGGSGGGSTCSGSQGTGNTPPVSPSQGNPGGGPAGVYGSGGGGAGGAGAITPQVGGASVTTQISGSPTALAGGGGGGSTASGGTPGSGGAGGGGGGGAGGNGANGTNGTINTGGGGGGGPVTDGFGGGAGGSGIVIIRYKFQN
jgi:hypothetical protein